MNARDVNTRAQRGAASVEFALVALFVLVPMVMAVVDFGQMFNIRTVLSRATEVGALAAADGRDPTPLMRDAIARAGLSADRLGVSVTPGYATLPPGSSVTVDSTYDLAGLPILPWQAAIPSFSRLSAQATARRR